MNTEGLTKLTKDETFSISISICNWVVVPGVRLELCTDSAEFAKGIQMVSTKERDSRGGVGIWPRNSKQNHTCFKIPRKDSVLDVVRNCSMNAIKWGCVIKCGGGGGDEGESWDLVTIDGAPTPLGVNNAITPP